MYKRTRRHIKNIGSAFARAGLWGLMSWCYVSPTHWARLASRGIDFDAIYYTCGALLSSWLLFIILGKYLVSFLLILNVELQRLDVRSFPIQTHPLRDSLE